jgi:hypothetical protein
MIGASRALDSWDVDVATAITRYQAVNVSFGFASPCRITAVVVVVDSCDQR